MDDRYIELQPADNIAEVLGIKGLKINRLTLLTTHQNVINMDIEINSFNAVNELSKLKNIIEKEIEANIDLNIEYSINILDIDKYKKELLVLIIELLKRENSKNDMILLNYDIKIINKNIYIKLPDNLLIKESKDSGFSERIISKFREILKDDEYICEFINGDFKEIEEILEKDKENNKEVVLTESDIDKLINPDKREEVITKGYTRKNKIKINDFSVIDKLEISENIGLEGEIFFINQSQTKTGSYKLTFYITDGNTSIECFKFINKKEEGNLSLGDIVRVRGIYNKDRFRDEYIITVKEIELVKKSSNDILMVDEEKEKRIELSVHTNMSEMISNIDAKSLLKRVEEYGHQAVAVTDYGVVHNYPFLYNNSIKSVPYDKEKELAKYELSHHTEAFNGTTKIIFGLDAYVVNDEDGIVNNPRDINIMDEEYIVFDLETTGFDPYSNKIIEIGAVKIKNGNAIDEFSEFVNPEMPLSKFTSDFTKITDEMLKNVDTIDMVLPRFLEFCGDATLVAHNAAFDIGFITRKAIQLGIKFENRSIDTLNLAKALLPKLKKYGLKPLTKYFNVNLDNHHRAIDDSRATSIIFQKMIQLLIDKGITNIKDINKGLIEDANQIQNYVTTILIKNLKGLKSVYELVSLSHIKYYNSTKPIIPLSLLKKHRNNLLLSSYGGYGRNESGEIVSMYIRGFKEEDIIKAIDKYDYIQLLPISNYNEAIDKKEIPSIDFIKEMNKKIYKWSNELNKIVVATGNVHYLNKKENIIRSVLALGSGSYYNNYHYDLGLYYRNTKEMLDEFDYFEEKIARDIVIYNTHKINDMIEVFNPVPRGAFRPKIEGAKKTVKEMTYNKAYELYGNPLPDIVEKRIEKELNSIIGNDFEVLYLIAQKLVKKSIDNGYLVGSRGSVGSSVVAFFMGITEVNALYPHYRCSNIECKNSEFIMLEGSGVDLPEKDCEKCGTRYIRDGHAIPFEVFMGFKGDKTPDIDLNFSGEYQYEIHKYTEELFGEQYVFRAGTISTLAEKNAEGYVKKYFEEEIKKEGQKNNWSQEIINHKIENIKQTELVRLGRLCEGARKTTGQHPGGMIVVPDDKSIYDFTPVQKPANDVTSSFNTTHFDYHVMDTQLVKLDILGHDDPTTLKNLTELTNIDIYSIPLTDEKVLSIFNSTDALNVPKDKIGIVGTNGIPEFGTNFVKQMLIETKPNSFAELVRISGLSHGTNVWLNNAQDYIKSGIAKLSEIITVRDDIMNYLIDQKMDHTDAFNIMEFVRKGMPKKDADKWKEYKKLMKDHSIKDWYIESCEKIEYMFPKGHAVAYVMMAMRIAYFKVYYHLEFYTAYLNRKIEDFTFTTMYKNIDELEIIKREYELKNKMNVKEKKEYTLFEILIEMNYRGVELLPVDIMKSDYNKCTIENGKIRLPLLAMDKLGDVVAQNIVAERKKGDFLSIDDLVKRCKINKTVIATMKEYKCLQDLSETNQMELFSI